MLSMGNLSNSKLVTLTMLALVHTVPPSQLVKILFQF